MSDEALYSEEELAGMNEWHELTHENLTSGPFRFYFTKLRSGSDEAEELFMDPLAAMRGGVEGLTALPGVKAGSKVTTTIFGHDRTLRLRMIVAVAAVDASDGSVSLTSYKVT
jgi:hypothetical protein